MKPSIGTILFGVAVVGNAAAIVVGMVTLFFVTLRREYDSYREHRRLAIEHDRAFHHPDKILTSLGEWLFLGGALVVVLAGLPIALAALFEFALPALGRAFSR